MGDPNRLIHGYDFRAELCGVDAFDNSKYTYFVNPGETTDVAICLRGCPVVEAENAVCLYDTDGETELLDNCYDSYESKPYFNRYCLPSDEDLRDEVDDFFDNHEARITLILGDIYRGWDIMGMACLIAAGVGLSFMFLMRVGWMTYVVVYSSMLLLVSEFAAVVYLVYRDSDRVDENRCDDFGPVDMQDCDSDENRYLVLTYVVAAICLAIVLIVTLMLPAMRRAINVFKASLRPLRNVCSLFIIPVLALILGGGILTSLVFSLIYGGSVGDMNTIDEETVPGEEVKVIDFYWRERYILLFVIAVHVWWLTFVSTVSEYLVASVATFWFFSKDKAILKSPVATSITHLFSNHIGSIALGSILIPLFRLPRVIVSGLKGIASKCNLEMKKCCSVTCYPCLALHESFLKYLVEDAYVYQAIWATTFCASAKRSYFVVKRSQTIPAKQMIASAHSAIWLMQVVVTVSAPIFTYYWVVEEDETPVIEEQTRYISWATALACLTLIGSSFVAQVVGGFFRGLVHASVHCLVSDSEMFIGDQRFADAELMEILRLDEMEKESASNTWMGKKVVPMPEGFEAPPKYEADTARDLASPHGNLAVLYDADRKPIINPRNSADFERSASMKAGEAYAHGNRDPSRTGALGTQGNFISSQGHPHDHQGSSAFGVPSDSQTAHGPQAERAHDRIDTMAFGSPEDFQIAQSQKPGEIYERAIQGEGEVDEPDFEVNGRPPSAKNTRGAPRGRVRGRGRGA
jgi:hypothetical protein